LPAARYIAVEDGKRAAIRLDRGGKRELKVPFATRKLLILSKRAGTKVPVLLFCEKVDMEQNSLIDDALDVGTWDFCARRPGTTRSYAERLL